MESKDEESSVIETPFKKRAEVLKRLKEQMLLESTPGLKKRRVFDVGNLKNSPNESRMFLKELDSALASRGDGKQHGVSNLQDKLLDAEETHEDNEPDAYRDPSSIQDQQQESLSVAVFSQIKDTKARKHVNLQDESFVIQDNEPNFNDIGGLDDHNDDYNDVQIPSSPAQIETTIESPERIVADSSLHYIPRVHSPTGKYDERDVFHNYSTDEESINEEQEIEGSYKESLLQVPELRKIVESIPGLQNIDMPRRSWKALGSIIPQLIANSVQCYESQNEQDMRTLNVNYANVKDMLVRYNLCRSDCTKEQVFETACNYLTLEQCNLLELEMFSEFLQ